MDPPSSLTRDVYAQLHEALVAGAIPPGERLKTMGFAQRFGVSLSAVREALSRLSAEGLVTSEPQRGFRAASISIAELRHLSDAVAVIESECLRRSILEGDQAWEQRVRQAYEDFSGTALHPKDDPVALSPAFRRAYADFRLALASACGNPVLMQVRESLLRQSQRHEALCAALGAQTESADSLASALVEAALARDAARAVALLQARIAANTALLEAALRART